MYIKSVSRCDNSCFKTSTFYLFPTQSQLITTPKKSRLLTSVSEMGKKKAMMVQEYLSPEPSGLCCITLKSRDLNHIPWFTSIIFLRFDLET